MSDQDPTGPGSHDDEGVGGLQHAPEGTDRDSGGDGPAAATTAEREAVAADEDDLFEG